MPDKEQLGETGMATIFLIVQHGTRKIREKYSSLVKQFADPKDFAMMEDRMLLENGFRQKYGSQVIYKNTTDTYEVRAIEDPLYVNERRKSVGLGPIEEYLKRWSIVWDPAEHLKRHPKI